MSFRKTLQGLHMSLVSDGLKRYSKPLKPDRQTAIVVAPHPDDETFGCGGLIALKRKAGATVIVVFLTDGGAAACEASLEQSLAQVRSQEALTALSILGVDADQVHFLNYPDGQLSEFEPSAIVVNLSNLIKQYQPAEVYVPHAKDHHCDHEAAFRLVKTAVQQAPVNLFQYAIWALWGSPFLIKLKPQDFANSYRVEIQAVQQQKREAIAVYRSQHGSLPPQFLKQFEKPFELFFKVEL